MRYRHKLSSGNPRLTAHVPPPSKCVTGKVAYKKKKHAKAVADKLARQANPYRKPSLAPYDCHWCGEWHLFTQKPRLRK